MKNAVGRNIPDELLAGGKEVYQGKYYMDGRYLQKAAPRTRRYEKPQQSKIVSTLADALRLCGARDGMTFSFHHHLRDGDYVANMVMTAAIDELGLKDLTIAASSLGSAHDPIADYIEQGKVIGIQTSGIRGRVGEVVSAGKLKTPAIIRSHGGRPRAIEAGEVHIDIAFVAAPTSDCMGNCRGVGGKSDCGSMGYAMTDAKYADHVVVVTDCLVDYTHRLYLTATPDSVIHDICEAEQCNLAACASCPRSFCCGKGKLFYYKFPSRSRHVYLRYFRDRSEIAKLIKDTPQDQFLIFTSSREDILNPSNGSYSKLLSESGISYGYLDADSKGSLLWKTICKNGVFDSQVLIATSVLDCGINLVSPRLRHIIVETCEQTEFLQMIGRRRLQADDSINVYVRAYTATAVQRLLDSVNRQRRFIQQASQMIHSGQMDKLVYNGWMDETLPRPYKHLLNYLGKGAVLPKRTVGNYLIW